MTADPLDRVRITKVPLPLRVRDVILFGGSFDPVHRGHVELPRMLLNDRPDAWLLVVPAARSPFKEGSNASDRDRLRMLRLAYQDAERVAIWTDELDRAHATDASYMIDTVVRLLTRRPELRVRLLIGSDQAVSFHKWRQAWQLERLAEPLVMLRSPEEGADAFASALRSAGHSEVAIDAWLNRVVELPLRSVSSTRIRDRLASGDAGVWEALPAKVSEFVRSRGLYRS